MSRLKHDLYRQSLGAMLVQIIKNVRSDHTEKDIKETLWERVRGDESVFRLLFENWFNVNYSLLVIQREEHSVSVFKRSRPATPKQLASMAAAARAHDKKWASCIDAVVDRLIPIALEMTFAQCAQAGGRFAALSKLGRPSELVGRKLTAEEVRNVWSRGNKRAS